MTMTVIQHIELGSAQANITFSSIPGTYTDLYLLVSARYTASGTNNRLRIEPNGLNTNGSTRFLVGNGSTAASGTHTNLRFIDMSGASATANTFGSFSIYIPNYTSSAAKSFSVDGTSENNSASDMQMAITAGLWNSTAAITSLVLKQEDGSDLASGTSATLYGITKGSDGTTTVS